MSRKSLITKIIPAILVAGATLLPMKLSAQESYLPKEIKGIKLSEGEIEYFQQMQSTPELLKEKRNSFIRYEDYSAAIDYTKKAMAFAYSIRDNNMYSNLSRDLGDLTKEYNFIKSMDFGVFSNKDGKIIVYNYLNSSLEDSTRAKSFGLNQGRKKLVSNQKQRLSKYKKYNSKDEQVKVMSYGNKTLYLYFLELEPKKLNEEVLKSLPIFSEKTPFNKK